MEYLLAVDLEGIHGVVGEPYKGLGREIFDYSVAIENAKDEVNAAARALFDCGATKVVLWDNHGGRENIDTTKLDPRIECIRPQGLRMEFLKEYPFDGVVFLGYHAKEGSLNGVLAHTFNSSAVQYYKINGKQVGEFDFDARIAGGFGVSAIFTASDDVAVGQMKECSPETITVLTKTGTGRNSAIFREKKEVLQEIYEGVKQAAKKKISPVKFTFPVDLEIRYTRVEDAAWFFEQFAKTFGEALQYGEDAHVLKMKANNVDELRKVL